MKRLRVWEFLFAFTCGWFIRGLSPTQALIFDGVAIVVWLVVRTIERRLDRKALANIKEHVAQPKSTITAHQLILAQRIAQNNDAAAVIELWADIYGHRPDLSRPFAEIVDEVSVALTQMSP